MSADQFEVVVGDESYQVTLSSDENLAEAVITPGLQANADGTPRVSAASKVARVRKEPSPAAAAPAARKPAGPAGKGALTAPMPGVILEIKVKAGDAVERGQPVAVLDAMKMHNTIASPHTGVVAEVLVAAGQTVDHGEAILRYREA